MRPRLSSSTSAAPAKNSLTKSLVSFLPVGSSESFWATFSHSDNGYTNRQESKPRVTIARFPRSLRNLAGTAKRLFESKLCKHFHVEKSRQRKNPSVQRTLGVEGFAIPLVSLSETESPP